MPETKKMCGQVQTWPYLNVNYFFGEGIVKVACMDQSKSNILLEIL